MIPVLQTIYDRNLSYHGNCLQACVASLFEMSLESVPNFMLFKHEWWSALYLFLDSINVNLIGYVDGEPPNDDQYYIVTIDYGEQYHSTHVVIYKNGAVVHDPQPTEDSNNGKIVGYYKLQHRC